MKRFEREEADKERVPRRRRGVEEEKTKKLKRRKETSTETTTLARFLARENEDKFAVQNPSSAQKTSLIDFECEERWKTVRDAVIEGVLTRAEQFFLFQNKNEEFLSLTKGVVPSGFDDDDFEDEDDDFEDEDVENHRFYRGGGGGHSERRITHMLSFAMVDVACAAVDFAEEVVRAFASGECTTESAWAYEVLSASCFRLSLKTRERRDRFDVDYEEEMCGCEEEKKNNFSVPISTITFDKETMAKMETVILTTLEYRVSKPTRSMWAKEFLNAMKKNVEIVAFGSEGARPKEFKRLWTKAEEHACVIVAASLRSFPTSPQFRASAIGAAAATLGVALSAFEYLREEEEEEEEADGKEEEGKQQKREHQHAAFVSDVKKLVKATAVNAFDFGSWEREFEIAFVSFSKYHHHHHHLLWDCRRDRQNNKAPLPPRREESLGEEEEKMAPADNKEKEEKEEEERIVVS